MKPTCQICGEHVDHPKPVDVSKGARLCGDCYEEYVWACDSCGRQIASPDVEGGELEGFTPLAIEHWCQECCDEKTAECEECGGADLIEDMTSTSDGLRCEQCAAGHGPSVAEDSPVLTKDNWRDAVLAAVAELPDDIQQSVGYHVADDGVMIRVACEPIDDEDRESFVAEVQVRWWNTRREELESYIRESPGLGLEGRLEVESEGPTIELPSISIEPDGATGPTSGLVPAIASIAMMKGMIQEAILNELYEGGGLGMVFKDRNPTVIDCAFAVDGDRLARLVVDEVDLGKALDDGSRVQHLELTPDARGRRAPRQGERLRSPRAA